MAETLKYTAVIVGAGTGGYPCAIRLGQLGVQTLIIEREHWGGVCLNVGCIPSKALITAGKRFEELDDLGKMGISIPEGDRSVDMQKLQEWKQGIVSKLTGGVRTLLKANKADTLVGEATFTGPHSLTVATADGEVRVEAEHLVIATGSRPVEIPGFSFADPRILDSTKALALTELPRRLVVIGGGYIGMEMGQMFRKLGSEVTIVEMQDSILPGFDPDVIKLMNRKLKKSKIPVYTGSRALGWEEGEDGATVRVQTPKGEITLDCDAVLVTVGRRPNSEGLEATGVELDRGFVKIDKQCRTSVPGVYAVGDVAGGAMLAHKATHEGEICAEVIAGHNAFNDARTVPAVVFTDPEIATAGLQEHEARAQGFEVKTGVVPFAAIGRALTTMHTDGFVKTVLDAADDRVLGVTICGPHASDLISEAALAVEMDAEALDIALTIHPHPTLGEALKESAMAALGRAIHVVNR
ncbi:MAG: dihydrolipoyl dehydrogenase [Deltaproteobacteria bacterium]|nr:MAG: dihydrolipoyl dehydrogenase [Deltaproteobacteria bacterium]